MSPALCSLTMQTCGLKHCSFIRSFICSFIHSFAYLFIISDGSSWTVHRTRTLTGAASPDYVAVEEDGEAIIISSEKPFKFLYDSEKPVEAEKKSEKWVVVDKGEYHSTKVYNKLDRTFDIMLIFGKSILLHFDKILLLYYDYN